MGARLRRLLTRAFRPPAPFAAVLIPFAAAALAWALRRGIRDLAAYLAYLLSAYALAVALLRLPRLFRWAKAAVAGLPPVRAAARHPLGHRLLYDAAFRGMTSIYQGLVVNTLYALFRGVTAILYASVWYGAIAAYYLILSLIRLILARWTRRAGRVSDPRERQIQEMRCYRICGGLILLLNSAMAGMILQMVLDDRHFQPPGFVIYASAAYTFYLVIMAVVNLFRFRKLNRPILSASKALTFVGALMSLMALQTAMIARFGGGAAFRRTANALTGGGVCLAGIATALFMLLHGTRQLRELHNSETKPKENGDTSRL